MAYLDVSGVTTLTSVYDNRYAAKSDISGLGSISNSTAMSANVSTTSGTWMTYSQNSNMPKITLSAGVYILEVKATFSSGTTGTRIVTVDDDQTHTDLDVRIGPSLSGATRIKYCKILAPTATTTYYMSVYQNNGTSLDFHSDSYLKAVRII